MTPTTRTGTAASRRIEPKRRVRLAHVITGLELGGGSAVLQTIAGALDWSRFELDVFCIHEGGPVQADLEKLGCKVTLLEGAWDYRRWFLPYSPSKILQLSSMLRHGSYDVVHTHLFPADVIGRIAARIAGVPVIVKSLHNMGHLKKRRHVLVDRLLATCTDSVICCSHFQLEVATEREGIPPSVGTTIHHGVNLKRFAVAGDRTAHLRSLGLRTDRRTIGTVGRPIPEKGQMHLVNAMPEIVRRHPDVQFLIVGEGSERGALESRVDALGLRDRVCFAGARSDIAEMLGVMDVFAFPSMSEGFGIAVIEAMAARLPVVASRIRPLTEIVVDGVTGRLVEPASPPAFATAICDLLDSEELRRRFAEQGRKRAEQYFTDRYMAGRLEDLYVKLCLASAQRRGDPAALLLCQ